MAKLPTIPSAAGEAGQKRTLGENIVVYTPVILTVLATVLAGVSSSEMSAAQYYRSIAAQMQSKVSDQWGFFQAKRLREEQSLNSIRILENLSQPIPLDAESLRTAGKHLVDQMKRAIIETVDSSNSAGSDTGVAKELTDCTDRVAFLVRQLNQATTQPDAADAVAGFFRGDVPRIEEQTINDPAITDSIRAVDARVPEADLEREAGQIDEDRLDHAVGIATDNAVAFDNAIRRMERDVSRIAAIFDGIATKTSAFERSAGWASDQVDENVFDKSRVSVHEIAGQLNAAFSIAGLRFNSARYDRDARYNQVLAQLYEVRVRKESFLSERHRLRSKEFFYVMLGAQTGVTIATLSLAVRRRMVLWGIAVAAGLAAISFAAYVYLFV
ncbi:MAG: DUF4337 family protein [Tepidisphaeraceae bacterium]|jgi:hypothetical protein